MKLVHICTSVLDCIFPPSSDELVVRALTTEQVNQLYTPMFSDGMCTLAQFQNAHVRALIHEAKFHHNTRAYELLGILMTRYFNDTQRPIDIVVPIPLSPARMRARGYNQVHEVLKRTVPPHGAEIRTNILIRKIHTKPQTELKRSERLQNVRGAFGTADSSASRITGKHLVLVDDVTTTGATLQSAKHVLQRYSPASITCVALAH